MTNENIWGHTDRISQQLSVSLRLHLESLGHKLDKTGIGVSSDRHEEADSDVQIG